MSRLLRKLDNTAKVLSLDEKYRKHVDNILVLVSTGRVQKVRLLFVHMKTS